MNKRRLLAGVLGGMLLAIASCAKKEEAAKPEAPKPESVALVAQRERSRHFLAVNRQLELGGTLYAYADVDGDVFKVADALHTLADQVAATQPRAAPFMKQDFRALFGALGFDDVKAFGLSSVPEGDGFFRNRVFFYTPDGRHGLLAGLGGSPAPFAKLKLAPADADFYAESEMDLAEVYKTLKTVVAKVGGDTSANLLEDKIRETGEKAAISLLGLINSWKGHTVMVARLEQDKTLALPGLVLPLPSVLICIDGVAPAVEPMLQKSPMLKMYADGSRKIYRSGAPLPLSGLDPVIVIDGSTLCFSTTTAFLDECIKGSGGLEQSPAFQQARDRVSRTGNGLVYVTPRLFQRLHDLEKLNPNLPPDSKRMLGVFLQQVPQPSQPLVTVRTNLPDGILILSHWDRSLKQDVAAAAMYNPVSLGLVAAMAIPAFQKVRTASEQKAILNNLRQLSAAADQYYLENGVDTVRYDQLVGPGKYVQRLVPVAGENYRSLIFKQGKPLVVRTAAGVEVRYDP
ncbi:MAG TPA: hypothetical protein VFJ90_14930 [Candidatus Didemnitutus sp.]|nr:hypothetical protein [Candidatus Didemnitutus sp.]